MLVPCDWNITAMHISAACRCVPESECKIFVAQTRDGFSRTVLYLYDAKESRVRSCLSRLHSQAPIEVVNAIRQRQLPCGKVSCARDIADVNSPESSASVNH